MNQRERKEPVLTVQSAAKSHPFEGLMGYTPLTAPDAGLYAAMREAVPIIDASLDKIVRLTGGFSVECGDEKLQPELERFIREVKVGPCSRGLHQFTSIYLDGLLTYGNAVGEMVLSPAGDEIAALYNAKLQDIRIRTGKNPLDVEICTVNGTELVPVKYPGLVLFCPLNPPAGEIRGTSLLCSLPFVTGILLKIYNSVGRNFDRVANLRYAVTCRPDASMDRSGAREVAQAMASEWTDAMESERNGAIKDFIAVGDVDIKVIGADNRMIDTQVPVRQMLEQIIAKLGIPPFMLGLSWSSTERMSAQQADILTSELWSYRRLMEGVILRIVQTWLALRGSGAAAKVVWDEINIQDEVESQNARHIAAQAALLEQELERGAGR